MYIINTKVLFCIKNYPFDKEYAKTTKYIPNFHRTSRYRVILKQKSDF